MADIAQRHQDKLEVLKNYVSDWREYFQDNINSYHVYRDFVFRSSMTAEQTATMQALGKPTIEFNILEAFISRQRGEFAKQSPSLTVRAADGIPLVLYTKELVEQIEVVESHLRAIFFDGTNDKLDYDVYTDCLAGGFSAIQIYTDYVNPMSFEQNIYVDRVFDPTLCGFDPLARTSHKGDGRYCFEIYPMTEEDFKKKFGEDELNQMKFARTIEGFSWSYNNGKENVIMVCDFYLKENKDKTIIELTSGEIIPKDAYPEFITKWNADGNLTQAPQPNGKSRKTTIETICRYRFCETRMLSVSKTNYTKLPIIFVDGNSIQLKKNEQSTQMTRPYVYHAMGIQRLKNFAGQTLANELENLLQSKFIMALESMPEERQYLDFLTDIQRAGIIPYNHFYKQNPDVQLPPPREVVRTPIPPQISETFGLSDEMTKAILGSYDQSAGMQNSAMSGIAFARSAIQSNNAAMPYIVSNIKAKNRCAEVLVDLFPKYFRTPRSLPVLGLDGKRSYVAINNKGGMSMSYDPNHMQVKVDVGVNFAMQKEIALQTLLAMMQASPLFADFMNRYGLQTLLDNIEIRGVDSLKEKAIEFEKELEQQKGQQQQMAQKQQQMQDALMQKQLQSPTPEQIQQEAVKTQTEYNYKKLQADMQIASANTAIKEQDAETRYIETLSKIESSGVENQLKAAEIEAENTRTSVNLAIDISKHLNEKVNGHYHE